MKTIVQELRHIVDSFAKKFDSIAETEFSAKPLPHKWSKKEVLGHLIDSAHNNLRRFVCGQYETAPPKITYDQDFWASANGYQKMAKDDVILMWKLINGRIAAVLEAMPEENYRKEVDTGKSEQQLHSLQWLAEDYVSHMKHHLNQILPKSFINQK